MARVELLSQATCKLGICCTYRRRRRRYDVIRRGNPRTSR